MAAYRPEICLLQIMLLTFKQLILKHNLKKHQVNVVVLLWGAVIACQDTMNRTKKLATQSD